MSGSARLAPFFLCSFIWNFALGMTYLLVPLYARSLGMPGVEIGILLSAPVLVQIIFSLVGGAWTDVVGGKNMTMASCFLCFVAALVFMVSGGFMMMMAAQVLMVMSRAMFWPASWALASQLPGEASVQMGRFNSANHGGQIAGTAAAGVVIAWFGYVAGFGVMAACGLLAMYMNHAYKFKENLTGARKNSMFAKYRQLLAHRQIYFSVMCAIISALPMSLSFSFYPILLVEQGFSSDATGSLISLRGLGSVIAGVLAGYVMRNAKALAMPVLAGLIVGLSVILVAMVSQPFLIAAFLFIVGVGSALMTLHFQMLISYISTIETRGSAMALGGLGWSISHILTPILVGAVADWLDIRTAFYVCGAVGLVFALVLIPMYHWAFKEEERDSA